ncbi:MAG TPA: PaaI family thioesterase [Thermodesulfobacteriota bacterium]|jgi:acyl-coenzyme A thioesterase PaaI-like protein|nr:PaaI family thioesterase [Thermodesulfobacteriota bacterium]
MAMDKPAIQDYMEINGCWGCGSLNEHGLRLKSYLLGDESICTWKPEEYHMAGPKGVLNGGIIATIMDCHSICTAIADAYGREGRELGTEPFIWYVTASLKVDYLLPTPIDRPVTLRARVKEVKERKTVVACSLFSGKSECARAEVLAVRVPVGDWYKE